ncbi:glycosyltransferase family 32 protein [Polychaeton citri CBS 116435]|uniref:Glycosyltransferase family 32 protein n=1 Tax=Polychaeton citri CBS 116435 TaxID=1314669 RepID=A0A9P4UNS8_9PEZI|nr:glycosyltransferase family 32 protein [Polychaeton citri CBS 116435]
MLHYVQHRQDIALFLTLFALISLARNHIRDLSEIVRTYATFNHLHLNIYTFPRTEEQALQDVHEEASTAKYQEAIDSCTSLHPGWEYQIWTDDNATCFGYEQTIQRTNILRYLLLHYYGGVYLDLDITCRINNAFILSKPQHAFLTQLIERIPGHDLSWPFPYVENMLTTGCMFISNMWMQYMRHDAQHEITEKLFVLADQDGGLEAQMLRGNVTTPLFEHGGASSWHGRDAAFFVTVGQHRILVILSVAGSAALMIWLGSHLWQCHKEGRRKSLDEEALLIKLG